MIEDRRTGTIRVWYWSKQAGFITPDGGGPDVLFSKDAVPASFGLPKEGMRVSYVPYGTLKGVRASAVYLSDSPFCPTCGKAW